MRLVCSEAGRVEVGFRLMMGLVFAVSVGFSRGDEPSAMSVWKPADLLEAELLFGFGNGMHGRVFEKNRDSAVVDSNPDRFRRKGLESLYQAGLGYLRRNQFRAAEGCFLEIQAADPADWEAKEGLVRIYQALGFKDKRDSVLEELRGIYLAGKAWGRSICRDEFLLHGKSIKAFEIPSFEFPERRRVLFGVQDSAGGRTRFLAMVSRMQRRIRLRTEEKSPEGVQSIPGYQISFVTERKRRVYFIAYHKPGYSAMKRMLASYLASG